MRIDVHVINLCLTDDLRQYAERRTWQAVRPWSGRVVWVGAWLMDREDESARISCRLDAWVRGLRILTVSHFDEDPFVAVDIAAARLRQTLARRVRQLAQRRCAVRSGAAATTAAGAAERPQFDGPRLAVVIERSNLPRRLSLVPWLRAKYGIEQVSRLSLPASLWREACSGSGLAEELRDRLSLSMLCWPELVVVVGRAAPEEDAEAVRLEQEGVRRIVQRLAEWDIPVEVVGVWIEEAWEPACKVVSRELIRHVHGFLDPARERAPADDRRGRVGIRRSHGRTGGRIMWLIRNESGEFVWTAGDHKQAGRCDEVFLDFDPVGPYWPEESDGAGETRRRDQETERRRDVVWRPFPEL